MNLEVIAQRIESLELFTGSALSITPEFFDFSRNNDPDKHRHIDITADFVFRGIVDLGYLCAIIVQDYNPIEYKVPIEIVFNMRRVWLDEHESEAK